MIPKILVRNLFPSIAICVGLLRSVISFLQVVLILDPFFFRLFYCFFYIYRLFFYHFHCYYFCPSLSLRSFIGSPFVYFIFVILLILGRRFIFLSCSFAVISCFITNSSVILFDNILLRILS